LLAVLRIPFSLAHPLRWRSPAAMRRPGVETRNLLAYDRGSVSECKAFADLAEGSIFRQNEAKW